MAHAIAAHPRRQRITTFRNERRAHDWRTVRVFLSIMMLLLGATIPAVDTVLDLPLCSRIPATGPVAVPGVLRTTVTIPAEAPADLGVGVYVADRHGRWWGHPLPERLTPGIHELVVDLGRTAFVSEPMGTAWDAAAAAVVTQAGLYLWSAHPARIAVTHAEVTVTPASARAETNATTGQLCDLTAASQGHTGERWTLTCRPDPLPDNPYDPERFRLDAVITGPDGVVRRIPGFWYEPMARQDLGDGERITPTGAGCFTVRFRPALPGAHRVVLEAVWNNGAPTRSAPLTLTVAGSAWDGYVRTDAKDPRFFARDGAFVWPVGVNLHSFPDRRSASRLGTSLTPARGTFTYDALLARFAAHGVNAVEIWMSAWNFALEWRGDQSPYQGRGRFSNERAWQLDRVLDQAERLGVGVKLVLDNHGKATRRVDPEWDEHPWNTTQGGPIAEPEQFFTDPRALAGQAALRRYLAARYADHPALLTWKLWSEANLTAANRDDLVTWHEQAAAHLHGLDTYRHPISTHWNDDYRKVDRRIATLPGIDLVTIDAYHNPDGSIIDLITAGLAETGKRQSLASLRKPVWISEYGLQSSAGNAALLATSHATGAWLTWVCGYAGSPMLWWWEWVDQGDHFAPYQAIRAFTAGEDLRGANATSIALAATSPDGALWARAWVRPGRVLGYIVDRDWVGTGDSGVRHEQARITVGSSIAAGAMQLVWYNADTGAASPSTLVQHPGGALVLTPPSFARHLAFKLWRTTP